MPRGKTINRTTVRFEVRITPEDRLLLGMVRRDRASLGQLGRFDREEILSIIGESESKATTYRHIASNIDDGLIEHNTLARPRTYAVTELGRDKAGTIEAILRSQSRVISLAEKLPRFNRPQPVEPMETVVPQTVQSEPAKKLPLKWTG
ncbi:MAG: hypothetical protein ACHQX1_02085 [Candidatus Micrarchaeales archaeon]